MQLNTFKEYSIKWLHVKKLSVKQSTYQRYNDCLLQHIYPYFGALDVNQIDQEKLSSFFELKSEELGTSRLKTIKYLLKTIIQFAGNFTKTHTLHFEYIQFSQNAKNKRLNMALNKDDYVILSNYIIENNNSLSISLLFGLFGGLRIGEVCALQWKDIDFDLECVYVTKTVIRVKNYAENDKKTVLTITAPKTETSNRCVPLPSFIMEVIKKYYSSDIDPNCYILTNKNNYKDPNAVHKSFKLLMEKLNLNKNYHFHNLRHTYGTNCVRHNVDIKSLCEIMGHSNVSTTLSLYVHSSYEQKKEQINKITVP